MNLVIPCGIAASLLAFSSLPALAGGSCCSSSSGEGSTVAEAPAAHVQPVAANSSRDIVETAVAAGSFNTLAKALDAADLIGALKGDGPFTVFAPTDEAFAKLPSHVLEDLLKPENKDRLVSILKYHVVSGEVMAADVVGLDNATTLNSQRVDIKVKNGSVMIDKAKVVMTDIEASNGVIHVIDSVILPVEKTIPAVAKEAKQFKTLLAAVDAAGLKSTLMGEGPFTVFAPTDEAFAALGDKTIRELLKPANREQLTAILTYHVVPGRVYADQVVKLDKASTVQGTDVSVRVRDGRVTIDDAQVVKTDIEASNGVIHVIDGVLIPN